MPPRSALPIQLSDQVLGLIRCQGLRPGDRLPSVAELAAEFSAAPGTIREALQTLQVSGIVEIRHGAGTFVRASRERILLANPRRADLDPRTLLDLLDARRHVEPYLAELAAHRRTDDEVLGLERMLDSAKAHLPDRDAAHFHAGMGFHRAIAECSRHSVLAEMIDSLLVFYTDEQLAIHDIYPDPEQDLRDHNAILEAIKAHDSREARRLMGAHIRDVAAAIEHELERA